MQRYSELFVAFVHICCIWYWNQTCNGSNNVTGSVFYADIQIIFGTVYLRPELSAVESQGKAEFQKI